MAYERPSRDALLARLREGGYDASEGVAPHEDAHDSVRRFEHAGHEIEIHTHYRIVIDGVDFPDPIQVGDDGSVHYHGFPQYRPASAVDLVKRIAEEFSADTPPPVDEKGASHG